MFKRVNETKAFHRPGNTPPVEIGCLRRFCGAWKTQPLFPRLHHYIIIAMSSRSRRPSDLPKAAVDALRRGNLIGAITAVRRERQIGFKEAKEQVEIYIASQPALKKKMEKVVADAQRKFTRWMIGLAVIVAIVLLLIIWKLATSSG